MANLGEYLMSLYDDIDRESGLVDIERLHRFIKREGQYKITRNQIKGFLQGTKFLYIT